MSPSASASFIRMKLVFTFEPFGFSVACYFLFTRSRIRSLHSFANLNNSHREILAWLSRILSSNAFFKFVHCLMYEANLNFRTTLSFLLSPEFQLKVLLHHKYTFVSLSYRAHAIVTKHVCSFGLPKILI